MSGYAEILGSCQGVSSVSPVNHPSRGAAYRVTYSDDVGDLDFVVAPPRTPIELPYVELAEMPAARVATAPHVMDGGGLCYAVSDEEFRLDPRRPKEVAEWALSAAAEVARNAQRADGWADNELLREAMAYWANPADDGPRSVQWSGPVPARHDRVNVSVTESTILAGDAVRLGIGSLPRSSALLLRIDDAREFAAKVLRPCRLDTSSVLDSLPNVLDSSGRKLLLRAMSSPTRCVLLALDVGASHELLLGLEVRGAESGVSLLPVLRIDEDILLERGGARALPRPAIVIGCGAVGGHVAGELLRAGFRQIVLVDGDSLTPCNTYRHIRGGVPFIGVNKAALLGADLSTSYPHAEVNWIARPVETVFSELVAKLPDAVWVASAGSPTVHTYLSQQLAEVPGADLIVGWVEPLGLGGHVLRSAPGRRPGCYNCLFEHREGPAAGNAASLVAPGQRFGRQLAGCSQRYTPFGSVDAMEVAMELVRAAIETACASDDVSTITSWRRNSSAAEELGVELSHQLRNVVDGHRVIVDAAVFAPRSPCPTCGGRS